MFFFLECFWSWWICCTHRWWWTN